MSKEPEYNIYDYNQPVKKTKKRVSSEVDRTERIRSDERSRKREQKKDVTLQSDLSTYSSRHYEVPYSHPLTQYSRSSRNMNMRPDKIRRSSSSSSQIKRRALSQSNA